MEELDFIIEASIEQMDNSIKFLEKELLNRDKNVAVYPLKYFFETIFSLL